MRIAFVQMKPEFGKCDNNIEKATALMKTTPADLYVLPELFSTGYIFMSRDELIKHAQIAPEGKICRIMSDFARNNNTAVIYGFVEKASEGIFNSCAFDDGKGNFKLYRKLHLFINEKKYFDPGNLPLDIFSYRDAKIGMMICFDWIFPEVTRCLALMGADIVCHPSNLVLHYCQDTMKARSIENHIFTVTANRIGEEKRGEISLKFTGKSQITDCTGNVLYRASNDKEEVYCADINIEEAKNKNVTELNNLWQDRRVEFYLRLGEK